jgi:hypothetical protein
MGLFNKKADPIQSKAKALNEQIAALELEIKKLQRKTSAPEAVTMEAPQPVLRSKSIPSAEVISQAFQQQAPPSQLQPPQQTSQSAHRVSPAREPIFESFEQASPATSNEKDPHYNDLGVRKYDIAGAWRRMRTMISGPATHNPKLVSYLAAGSIRGLRPLRYEKRIARNRFIFLTLFFVVILWSMLGLFFSHR